MKADIAFSSGGSKIALRQQIHTMLQAGIDITFPTTETRAIRTRLPYSVPRLRVSRIR